jgi:branched-chain amino acid transport system substrate-binding protein
LDDQAYQNGEIDFKAQLNQIKSKNPDVVFIPGYYQEVGLIAKQAAEIGLKAKLLGGDGWDSDKLFEIGKEAVNGHYFSNHYASDSTDPVVQDFIKKYKQLYGGKTPDAMAALGYDAAKIIAASLEAAPEMTSAALKTQLTKVAQYPGVTGKITINGERNASKSAVVVQVEGNNRKYVTTVNP